MFQIVRRLGERYEVDLVAPALEGAKEAERLLQASCHDMEFVPTSPGSVLRRVIRVSPYVSDPALAYAVRRRLESGAYSAVQVEKPAMLPYLPKDLRMPIILDTWAYGLAGPLRALRHEGGLLTRARNLLQLIRFGIGGRPNTLPTRTPWTKGPGCPEWDRLCCHQAEAIRP
jgi:hypothetical protein